MKELLTVDTVSVSYGNIRALKEVTMHVYEGDIVCLIGANGAGKSTLLKAIVGLEPLVEGTITFDGEEICTANRGRHMTTDLIASRGIALVPEGRRVFADMTVEENLDMGAFLVRDDALIAQRKEAMYDFFPILGARKRQKTRSLSGGEQQMMAIARALMSGPRMILLDEPGLGLAP
ncbi:MAG TPA: ATP-binding cassette domain-containing protein, partial [Sphaerochaeta sp.]|nr:ATP-binding cassette domain-containing protein [Sphaerochaeta sp.]